MMSRLIWNLLIWYLGFIKNAKFYVRFKTFPMLVIDNIFADYQPGRHFLKT